MEQFLQQLKKLAQIKLSDDKKREILHVLQQRIESDVRTNDQVRHIQHETERSVLKITNITRLIKIMTATAVIAIVALLGGGVGFAAEGALPGDALYAIKTQVNEPIRDVLAVSAESQARWEIRKAERRAEEAALLAATGRSEVDAYATVRERLSAHADRAEDIIANVENRAGAEVAARLANNLEASLRAHETILMRLESRVATSTRKQVNETEQSIRAKAQTATHLRKRIESSLIGKENIRDAMPDRNESAEAQIKIADQLIVKTQTLIAEKADEVDEKELQVAKQQLVEARDILEKARTSFEQGAYGDAFQQASATMRFANQAYVIINSSTRIPTIKKGNPIAPSPMPIGDSESPQSCTQEAKMCPDGSYVGRTEPNCEFAECPTSSDGGGSGNARVGEVSGTLDFINNFEKVFLKSGTIIEITENTEIEVNGQSGTISAVQSLLAHESDVVVYAKGTFADPFEADEGLLYASYIRFDVVSAPTGVGAEVQNGVEAQINN